MTLAEIADAAGLSPNIGVRDLARVADQILPRLAAGESVDSIAASMSTTILRDGFRERALAASDVRDVATFLRAARQELITFEREAREAGAKAATLRSLLEVPA